MQVHTAEADTAHERGETTDKPEISTLLRCIPRATLARHGIHTQRAITTRTVTAHTRLHQRTMRYRPATLKPLSRSTAALAS